MISLGTSNIADTIPDCSTCNSICYKITDCNGYVCTFGIIDPTFEQYVGKVIKWIDTFADDFVTAERCAIVEKYVCRQEDYPTFEPGGPTMTVSGCFFEDVAPNTTFYVQDVTVLSCHRNCADCGEVPEEPVVEEPTYGRTPQPNYDVPDCVIKTTCNE